MIMYRRYGWFLEKIWAEDPATIQARISKETKRFSFVLVGSSALVPQLLICFEPDKESKGLGQQGQCSVSSTKMRLDRCGESCFVFSELIFGTSKVLQYLVLYRAEACSGLKLLKI